MKTIVFRRLGCLALLFTIFLAGCATKPKIDWAARVGVYTFDEAVTDYGPPDKTAKLQNGATVAEWLTRRGYRQFYQTGSYYDYSGPGRYGGFPPTYIDTSSPDYYLRLIFSPEGKLQSYKMFTK